MSIIIDQNTRLIVQGITGREGTFHTEQMLAYGTNVVAGVTPGKGGQVVLGVPVYNTVKEAMEKHNANATVIFVPAKFTPASVYEAIDAGVPVVITIAEHVPVGDMMRCYHMARMKGIRLFGPNSFGIISPGKSKAGFMDHHIFSEGCVGVMSRSATNCYETVFMMSKAGIGQSTCVGVGGDMIRLHVCGSASGFRGGRTDESYRDHRRDRRQRGRDCRGVYQKHVSKPVVALIAAKTPKGKSMGMPEPSYLRTAAAAPSQRDCAEAADATALSTFEIVEILKTLV